MGETNMKSIFASKTFWTNAIIAVVSIVGYFQGADWVAVHPEAVAALGTVVGVLNVILRLITKEPVKVIK